MKFTKIALMAVFLMGALGLSTVPATADGVLFKTRVQGTNYCHMKFPAAREGTLSSDQQVLKNASSGDIIDFYGPCDHDPLGESEMWTQRLENSREKDRASN